MANKLREPVSGLIHLVSAVLAAAGLVLLLIVSRGDALKQLSVGIYGFSLVLLFSASAIYHLVPGGEDALRRLRKFDHAAIYVLIAGTYTPICLNFFSGWLQWGFLALIWAMARMLSSTLSPRKTDGSWGRKLMPRRERR